MALPPEVQAKVDAAKKRQEALAAANRILTPEEYLTKIIEVPSLVETKDSDVEHAILYGDPGTGKTLLAGLLAEFYNILWFDGDKGLRTLYSNLPKELMARIRIIRIPDSTANPIFVATMLKVITGRQVRICEAHGIVDCPECKMNDKMQFTIALNLLPRNWIVCMDSLTQFVMSAMCLSFYKVNPEFIGKDVDEFWRGEKDDVFKYWGGLKNVMDKFGNYTKDLECNFIATSHEAITEREKQHVPVSGSENTSKSFLKYFGTGVNCKIENNKHKYISSELSSSFIQAKSRSNVNLEKVKCPSLLHIFRPEDAAKLLEGSFNEWYLTTDHSKPAPKPKEILPL